MKKEVQVDTQKGGVGKLRKKAKLPVQKERALPYEKIYPGGGGGVKVSKENLKKLNKQKGGGGVSL